MLLESSLFVLLLQAADERPAAQELLTRARLALGLTSQAISSLAGSGRLRTAASGLQRDTQFAWALWAPDRIMTTTEEPETSGVRIIRTVGYDGEVAWSVTSATGTTAAKMMHVREDPAYRWRLAEHLDREARAYSLVLLCATGPVAAFQRPSYFGTQDGGAWIIDVVASATPFRLFLDVKSLRPLKVTFRNNEPGVEDEAVREVELKVAGYRAVQGVYLPDQITRVVDGVVEREIRTVAFEMNTLQFDAFRRPAPE